MTARLAKKLGKLRKERNLSPEFVGEKLGMHPINLKKWEKAKEWPNHDILVKLAEIYEVPVEEFTSIIEMETAYDKTYWGSLPFPTIMFISFLAIVAMEGIRLLAWIPLLLIPVYRRVGEYLLVMGKLPVKK